MNQDEFFKLVGIIIVSFFIIYMIIKMFHLQSRVVEGLTNNDSTTTTTSITTVAPASGEAGSAASYAASIKSLVVKLQDELLVAKYRKEYESAIINLDDYIGYLMIQQTLNMNLNGDAQSNLAAIGNLNTLNSSKASLNATMAFLDKQ